MKTVSLGLLCGLVLVGSVFAQVPLRDDSNVVVVSQGGVSATLGDVDAYVQRMPLEKRPGFIDSPKRIDAMLHQILQTKQLAKQAREMKLDPNDDGTSKVTYAQQESLARLRMAKLDTEIKAPDLSALAKETYQLHKADYDIPEVVSADYVLISAKKHADAEAAELAAKVQGLAQKNPANFDQLIEEYSEDPSKGKTHGHIDNVLERGVNPDFAQAATNLAAPGDISPVAKTHFGYVVIKLVAHTPGRHREYAEIKDEMIKGLQKEYVETQRQDFLYQLSNQPMDPNPEALATLHARYGSASVPEPADTSAQPAPDGHSQG